MKRLAYAAAATASTEALASVYADKAEALTRVVVATAPSNVALDETVAIRLKLTPATTHPLIVDEVCAQFILEDDARRPPSLAAPPRTLLCRAHSVGLPTSGAVIATGEAAAAGVYVFERLWFRVGRLVLSQRLGGQGIGSEEDITARRIVVHPSEASAAVEVFASGSSLVRGVEQRLRVLVHSNRDSLLDGALRLTWHADGHHALLLALDGEQRTLPLRLLREQGQKPADSDEATALEARVEPVGGGVGDRQRGVTLWLPSLEAQHIFALELPVRLPSTPPPAVTAATSSQQAALQAQSQQVNVPSQFQFQQQQAWQQELSCELSYNKHSGEQFRIRSALDLHFRQPFRIECSLLPLDRDDRDESNVPKGEQHEEVFGDQRLCARIMVSNTASVPLGAILELFDPVFFLFPT